MTIVIDASVAAKWFLPEPRSEAAARLLDGGHDLLAPDLVRIEVGSALLKAVRRGTLDAADAQEAIARLAAPVLGLEPATALADEAFAIAERHGGSIYDAIYIALARAMDAVVVTDDRELTAVAAAAGVRASLLGDPLPP